MLVQSKVFVVTGAGSGMGRELVLLLLAKGARVAMVDINEAGMAETAQLAGVDSAQLASFVVNIADRAAVYALVDQVLGHFRVVDGLINNAGIIQPFVSVNELDYERIERIMNINFYGTLYMVKAFLPQLLQRPEAHIANVASMGGFIPFPGQTIYGASKAAVKLLTEGLYTELLDTKVRVTGIFPGAVTTNITTNSGVKSLGNADQQSEKMKPLEASAAAEIMIRAIEKNAFQVMVGKDAKALNMLSRTSPARAARFIAKKMKSMLP